MIRHECPVCWQAATPSQRGNIAAHYTVTGAMCPGTGLAWRLARYVQHGIAREDIA